MNGIIIFMGLVSASLALYVKPEKTNLHNYHGKRLAPAGQRLDCYDRDDCTGARITVRGNSVPNLAAYPYHFDNRIQSCRFNGIYILYDWRYYNQNDIKVSKRSISSFNVGIYLVNKLLYMSHHMHFSV